MNSNNAIQVHMFPCLEDNYGYLVHDLQTGATASIDTPEVEPIERALEETGWQLTHILNTHHHFDHAGGNLDLKDKTGCTIVGPRADAARIPGIDVQVGDGDTFLLGNQTATVFDTPGHTSGHIVFYFADFRCCLRRRYVIRAGLRASVRRHARTNVELDAETFKTTG